MTKGTWPPSTVDHALMVSRRRCGCCERICERNATQLPRWLGTWRDGLDGRLLATCAFETLVELRNGDGLAHNPEVAGSNPVPATKESGPDQAKRCITRIHRSCFVNVVNETTVVGAAGGRISPHRQPVIAGLLAHWPPRCLTLQLSTGVRLHAAARSSGMCGCWRRLRPPTDGHSGKSEVPHGQGPGCGGGVVAVGAVETSIPSALRAATRLPQRLGTFVNRLWEPHCLSVTASRRTCRGSSSSGLRRQRW